MRIRAEKLGSGRAQHRRPVDNSDASNTEVQNFLKRGTLINMCHIGKKNSE